MAARLVYPLKSRRNRLPINPLSKWFSGPPEPIGAKPSKLKRYLVAGVPFVKFQCDFGARTYRNVAFGITVVFRKSTSPLNPIVILQDYP